MALTHKQAEQVFKDNGGAYRKIEAFLYNYLNLLSEIETAKEEIEDLREASILSAKAFNSSRSKQTGPRSSVEASFFDISGSDRINHLKGEVDEKTAIYKAITGKLNNGTIKEAQLIRLVYLERLPTRKAAARIGMSERSFYRLKRKIIAEITKDGGIYG